MMKEIIHSTDAPVPIGPYSQAVKVGNMVFLSGQVGFDLSTGELINDNIEDQIAQTFRHLATVSQASGGNLSNIVKLTIYLTSFEHYSMVNAFMEDLFSAPYPARSTIQVSALPKGALIEIDAIMVVNEND